VESWKSVSDAFAGAYLLLKGSFLGDKHLINIVPILTEWRESIHFSNSIDCSTSIEELIDETCLQSMTYPITLTHHYGWTITNITDIVKCQVFGDSHRLSMGLSLVSSATSLSESEWYSSESGTDGPIIIFVFNK
jgi:hypothetical protein